MAMQWTPDMSVGVDKIDIQHKELFIAVNELLDSMSKGRGKEEIVRTIRFLESYVTNHFGTEERYMAELGYASLTAHKTQHALFVQDFAQLKDEFEAQGSDSYMVLQVKQRICNWLLSHVGKTDKAFGSFLKMRMQV